MSIERGRSEPFTYWYVTDDGDVVGQTRARRRGCACCTFGFWKFGSKTKIVGFGSVDAGRDRACRCSDRSESALR